MHFTNISSTFIRRSIFFIAITTTPRAAICNWAIKTFIRRLRASSYIRKKLIVFFFFLGNLLTIVYISYNKRFLFSIKRTFHISYTRIDVSFPINGKAIIFTNNSTAPIFIIIFIHWAKRSFTKNANIYLII